MSGVLNMFADQQLPQELGGGIDHTGLPPWILGSAYGDPSTTLLQEL